MGWRRRLVRLLELEPEITHLRLDAQQPASRVLVSFDEYLSNLPHIHSWDGGVSWNAGGFEPPDLRRLHEFLGAHLPRHAHMLETGAGNSTICMLYSDPARLVSIAPDADLFARIRACCDRLGLSTAALETHVGGSEWVLPRLAASAQDLPAAFDFVLIDGCHNWPLVFVDFFYTNYLLKSGGYLMIDDLHLHPVKELARTLIEEPGFALALDLGKSLVFRRETGARALGEWSDVKYLKRKSDEYARSANPFAL